MQAEEDPKEGQRETRRAACVLSLLSFRPGVEVMLAVRPGGSYPKRTPSPCQEMAIGQSASGF